MKTLARIHLNKFILKDTKNHP